MFRSSTIGLAFHCFHGDLPVSAYPNSLKNLNSPTSPVIHKYFVPRMPSVPSVVTESFWCDDSGLSATRSDDESHAIRTAVPVDLTISANQSGLGASGSGIRFTIPVVAIVGTVGKNGSKLIGYHRFLRESFLNSP